MQRVIRGSNWAAARAGRPYPIVTLAFPTPHPRFRKFEGIWFDGEVQGQPVLCKLSFEALEDDFGSDASSAEKALNLFEAHSDQILGAARSKYAHQSFERDGSIVLKSGDVAKYHG